MNRLLSEQSAGLAMFMLALFCFFIELGHPSELVFDETHYVPAARELLALTSNTNPEHPLFAKEMISAGMMLFGDNSFGWRFFSALFSAFSVLAAYQIGLRLFRDMTSALLTTVLLLTSITVTVQARLAMLDSYCWPLFLISAACLILSSGKRTPTILAWIGLVFGGIFLGLSAASKWTTGIYAFLTLAALFLSRILTTLRTRRSLIDAITGRGFPSWPGISFIAAAIVCGTISLIVYFATFLPLLFLQEAPLTLPEIIPFQMEMLDLQTRPLGENSYESDWWTWPLMLEPIWYHFITTDRETHQAILYVGNPVTFWGGLIATVICLVEGIRQQKALAIWISLAWLASWLIFAILPKQIGFFFYYHGSGILLCFSIACVVSLIRKPKIRRVASAIVSIGAIATFLFFFPVIYATDMPTDRWTDFLWLPRWR